MYFFAFFIHFLNFTVKMRAKGGIPMFKFHQPDVMHIKSITLLVLDLKRSIEFYTDILGFSILEKTIKEVKLTVNHKDTLVTLIEDRAAIPYDETLGLYHVAFLLPSQKCLAETIRRLTEKRYPITGASDHGVSQAIYLDDPDGHGIEIYTDYDESLWPQDDSNLNMFTEPLNIHKIMSKLGDSSMDKLSEETIIGHLHFHVPTLEEGIKFFCDGLGFKVTLRYGPSAIFIADKDYHHHIGMNTWLNNAELTKEKQIGLKSYVLHVPKDQYFPFLKRLQNEHITLFTDGERSYLVDPMFQKVYIDTL